MKIKLSLVALFLLLTTNVWAASYYAVSTGGSGTTCSEASPCILETALNKPTAGDDIVYLKCASGTSCTFQLSDGESSTDSDMIITMRGVGTSGHPVLVKPYTGHTVVISAADTVASWSNVGTNRWRSNTLTHTPQTDTAVFEKDATVFPIKTQESSCSSVDAPGEYCLNTGSKYIEVYATSSPTTSWLVPYNNNTMLKIYGDYVTVEGINYEGSFWRLVQIGQTDDGTDTVGIIIDGDPDNDGDIDNYAMYGENGGIYGNGTSTAPYTASRITYMKIAYIANHLDQTGGGYGVKCGAFHAGSLNQLQIDHSLIYYSTNYGIWCSDGTNIVEANNNNVHDFNMQHSSGGKAGIGCNSANITSCKIHDNTIAGNQPYTSGIYVQGNPSGVEIYNNIIHDMVNYWGIYMFNGSPSGVKIYNNVFYDNPAHFKDDGSTSVAFNNNTMVDATIYSIYLASGSSDGVSLNNNICDNMNAYCFYSNNGTDVAASTYNRFYNAGSGTISHNGTGASVGAGTGDSIGTPPTFANRAGNDFQLSENGNGYEDGTCLASPYTTDILGSNRTAPCDQGAYENSPAGTPPTPIPNVTVSSIAVGVNESGIVSGGGTIILITSNDTWIATIGANNAATLAILSGIDSNKSEATGWDALRGTIPYTAVVRTSSTIVTITLPALPTYAISQDELLTATVPGSALTGGAPVVAVPSFTITNQTSSNPTTFGLTCTGCTTNTGMTAGKSGSGQVLIGQ